MRHRWMAAVDARALRGRSADGDFDRAGLTRSHRGVIRLEELIKSEMVRDEVVRSKATTGEQL